jgi:hypothetical protein
MPRDKGPIYGEDAMAKKVKASSYRMMLIQRASRRKQREARWSTGANTTNWPTRPRRESQVKTMNVADLSPAERERYGL